MFETTSPWGTPTESPRNNDARAISMSVGWGVIPVKLDLKSVMITRLSHHGEPFNMLNYTLGFTIVK